MIFQKISLETQKIGPTEIRRNRIDKFPTFGKATLNAYMLWQATYMYAGLRWARSRVKEKKVREDDFEVASGVRWMNPWIKYNDGKTIRKQ